MSLYFMSLIFIFKISKIKVVQKNDVHHGKMFIQIFFFFKMQPSYCVLWIEAVDESNQIHQQNIEHDTVRYKGQKRYYLDYKFLFLFFIFVCNKSKRRLNWFIFATCTLFSEIMSVFI